MPRAALVSFFLRDLSLFQKLLDSSAKLIDSIGTELKSYLQTLSNFDASKEKSFLAPLLHNRFQFRFHVHVPVDEIAVVALVQGDLLARLWKASLLYAA